MLNPFGTDAVNAMWQGFYSATNPLAKNNLVTRVGYGCVASYVPALFHRPGVLTLFINNPSVDANTFLPILQQTSNSTDPREYVEVDITFGVPPNLNAFTFTFGAPLVADLTLVNIIVWQGLPAALGAP
jgi:hypothetical protein